MGVSVWKDAVALVLVRGAGPACASGPLLLIVYLGLPPF